MIKSKMKLSIITCLVPLILMPCFAMASVSVMDTRNNVKLDLANAEYNSAISEYNILKKKFDELKASRFNLQENLISENEKLQDMQKLQEIQKNISKFQLTKAAQEENNVAEEKIKSAKIVKEKVPFSELELAKIEFAKSVHLLKTDEVRASEGFMKILEKFPNFHEARFELINLYYKSGWESEALALVDEGLKLAKGNSKYRLKKAQLLTEMKKYDKALTILLDMKKKKHETVESKALLAYVYLQMGQSDLAGRNYNQLISYNDNNSTYWLGLALSFESLGEINKAVKSFIKVKRLGGVNSEVLKFVNAKLHKLNYKPKNRYKN